MISLSANKTVSISIKAKGNGIAYSDSDWSTPISYDYVRGETDKTESFKYDQDAENARIGFGYDVIKNEYVDITKASIQPILDRQKMQKEAYLIKTRASSSLSGSIFASSIKDYSLQISAKYYKNVASAADFDVFTAGASSRFSISAETQIDNYSAHYFYTYFDYQNAYTLNLTEYGSVDFLREMLSQYFMDDLDRKTSQTRNLTDKELAEFLIDKYGTHLITGVLMGGRMEYSQTVFTQDKSLGINVKTHLDAVVAASMKGLASATSETGFSAEVDFAIKSQNTTSSTYISRKGCSSVGTSTETELHKNYSTWAASFNNPENADVIGLEELIPLWALIPEDYASLRVQLENVFKQRGINAYNDLLEKYTPQPKPEEEPYVLLFDLSPYQNIENANDLSANYNDDSISFNNGTFTIYPKRNNVETKKVIFKGLYFGENENGQTIKTFFSNVNIVVASRQTDLEIVFENVGFISGPDKIPIDASEMIDGAKLTITIVNNAMFRSYDGANATSPNQQGKDGRSVIVAKDLIVRGDNAKLSLIAGNGGNGKDGDSSNPNGSNGGNGGSGIEDRNVEVDGNIELNITSGHGGNGGNGRAGTNGTNGKDGINKGSSRDGGHGSTGSSGVNGGNAGRGGSAIVVKNNGYIIVKSTVSDKLTSGNSGNGGNGGNGGSAYKSAEIFISKNIENESRSISFQIGNQGTVGKAGKAGLGGIGGKGGKKNWIGGGTDRTNEPRRNGTNGTNGKEGNLIN